MASASPTCPLCASPETRVRVRFLSPPGVDTCFALRQCLSCGHRFTDPAPGADLLKRIYASQAHTEFQTDPGHIESRHLVDDMRWEWLESRIEPGLAVDIGCGSGIFLSRAPSPAWGAIGVEPETRLATFARDRHGLEVVASLKEAVATRGVPDLVTLWDVFEHLPDPRDYLGTLNEALPEGGHLVIGIPNPMSRVARLFGGHWCGWSAPAHLHHYTPEVLTRLLREAGLEVLEVRFWNYGFYLGGSWDRLMGACDAETGAFGAVPSLRARLFRKAGRRLPGVLGWVKGRVLRKIDKRIDMDAHADERDYFSVLARKNAGTR